MHAFVRDEGSTELVRPGLPSPVRMVKPTASVSAGVSVSSVGSIRAVFSGSSMSLLTTSAQAGAPPD
jgi:hypothetical protein